MLWLGTLLFIAVFGLTGDWEIIADCSGFVRLWLKSSLAGVGPGRIGVREIPAASSAVDSPWTPDCSDMAFSRTGDLANPAVSSTAFGRFGEPKSVGSCPTTAFDFAGLAKSTEEATGFLRDPSNLLGESIGSLNGVGCAIASAERGIFEGLIIEDAAIVSSPGCSLAKSVRVVVGASSFSCIVAKSCTSTCFLSIASSSSSSSVGSATFTALDVFTPLFGTAGFLAVKAFRDAVLIANVLGPVDFAVDAFFTTVSFDAFFSVVSSFALGAVVFGATFFTIVSFSAWVSIVSALALGAAVGFVDFGAVIFAAEAFLVAVLADVDAFDTELFNEAAFDATTFGAGFGAGSSSVFFGLPRRTGALRRPDFGGDSGGMSFACARWALVRTILTAGLV